MRTWALIVLTGLAMIAAACSLGNSVATTTTSQSVGSTTTTLRSTTTPPPPTTTSILASTTTPAGQEPIEVSVENGEVVGGLETIVFELGAEVWIVVYSDSADHVHVHGYDLFYDVTPELPADIMFVADIPGVFEIELEGAHLLIAELEVS